MLANAGVGWGVRHWGTESTRAPRHVKTRAIDRGNAVRPAEAPHNAIQAAADGTNGGGGAGRPHTHARLRVDAEDVVLTTFPGQARRRSAWDEGTGAAV